MSKIFRQKDLVSIFEPQKKVEKIEKDELSEQLLRSPSRGMQVLGVFRLFEQNWKELIKIPTRRYYPRLNPRESFRWYDYVLEVRNLFRENDGYQCNLFKRRFLMTREESIQHF